MRILFLTNFYRLNQSGGEDQSCQQVVNGLQQRGHATLVLTSMQGTNNFPIEEDGVVRSLYLEMDLVPWRHSLTFFTSRQAREQHNLACFERVARQFGPDIIFIWGMWNLPRSLPAMAEAKYAGKVVYRFATYWPTLPSQHEMYWRATGRKWYSRLVKQLVGRVALAMLARENHRPPLRFEHAICVSAATRSKLVEAGVPISTAKVIHTGVDAGRYLSGKKPASRAQEGASLNLLYAGRLVAEKGVDTAIHALEKLSVQFNPQEVTLTVAGSESPDYLAYLRQLVTQAGLDDQVSFLGHVPAEEMPQLLQKFDVLLLPSLWPEPFSRMLLEGMASGLALVATNTGGTPEILRDGENGLIFVPGDADDLAQKVLYLMNDRALLRRLAHAGQQTVLECFTWGKMVDEFEAYLQQVANNAALRRPASL